MSESATVTARLIARLEQAQIAFTRREHAPVFTSAEAAAVRGASLSSGAKALVCKVDQRFVMFVLPADRKLASKRARAALGAKSVRFADREELKTLTGLEPGSVPPFGSLFALATYCDERLSQEPTINFNAGDHSVSIAMSAADYLALEQPQVGDFAE
jgi:Ala-tRNA(Pro) deacylase